MWSHQTPIWTVQGPQDTILVSSNLLKLIIYSRNIKIFMFCCDGLQTLSRHHLDSLQTLSDPFQAPFRHHQPCSRHPQSSSKHLQSVSRHLQRTSRRPQSPSRHLQSPSRDPQRPSRQSQSPSIHHQRPPRHRPDTFRHRFMPMDPGVSTYDQGLLIMIP